MQAHNPYATPTVKVETNSFDEDFGNLRLFTADGRLGRLRYLMYSLGVGLLGGLIAMAVALLPFVGIFLAVAIYIGVLVVTIFLTIQRCHDFNMTGWLSLLLLIPLVSLVFYFIPGTKAENDYGYQPPPNTTAIKIGAFIMLGLFVLSILAAIALPVYQDYVMRAGG